MRHFAGACGIALLSPLLVAADAQVIRVKTIPVAESEQFSFLPSAGMAGVSIALADTLLDPFVNPAKGGRLAATQYFGAPSFFSVSSNSGAGSTFPLGALWKKGASFAGLGAAFQQVHGPRQTGFPFAVGVLDFASSSSSSSFAPPAEPRRDTYHNNYTFAMLGHTLTSARLSFAASALWSGLDGVDGVEQFYSANDWLRQEGEALDLRLGVVKEWANKSSLEAVVVKNRFGHAHDIGFTDLFWDPTQRRAMPTQRTEHNAERTSTMGLHLEYERPLADSGWRIGALVTGNRIQHAQLPGYDVMKGMGAAGRSSAFNAGVGVSRSRGPVVFGVDAIYEPITSRTWAADSLDNRFRFSNAKVRAGVGRRFAIFDPRSSLDVQVGAELYSVKYVMNQREVSTGAQRVRKEAWLERTRTAGMSFRFPGVEVHYHLRTRSGVGRPGVVDGNPNRLATSPPDIIAGPWMPPVANAAALGPVRVTWHQFAIAFPQR
jgi:hypothetical protein